MVRIPESVRKAVDNEEATEKDAMAVWKAANAYLSNGHWTLLALQRPRFAIAHPFGTSAVLFWGPPKLLKHAKEGLRHPATFAMGLGYYDLLTHSRAQRLFNRAVVPGKMHAVLTGSARYPSWRCPHCKRRNSYGDTEALERCMRCRLPIPKQLVKELERKTPSYPALTSRIEHRHWEIGQMVRRLKAKELLYSFLHGGFR